MSWFQKPKTEPPKMNSLERQREVFETNAKTFSFAAKFLGKKRISKIYALYEFCRYVDDIADESADLNTARERLQQIKDDLQDGESKDDYISEFLVFLSAENVDKQYITDLLDGVISDCNQSVRIKNEAQLMTYCYQVAGTVGALMCPLLGVKESQHSLALSAAINLGIAMQFTNIARDIREDAVNNRVYIPQSWLEIQDPKELIHAPSSHKVDAREACRMLLQKADTYYEDAKKGYAFLPFRERLTILIAGNLYQAIGKKIEKVGYQYWLGRQYLNIWEKGMKSLASLGEMVCPYFWFIRRNHNENLKAI